MLQPGPGLTVRVGSVDQGRLMSAFEADDWARSEAMPSEEEISRVRRLINRVKADLDDLSRLRRRSARYRSRSGR